MEVSTDVLFWIMIIGYIVGIAQGIIYNWGEK